MLAFTVAIPPLTGVLEKREVTSLSRPPQRSKIFVLAKSHPFGINQNVDTATIIKLTAELHTIFVIPKDALCPWFTVSIVNQGHKFRN